MALWDGTICLWRGPDGPPVAYQFEAGGATWLALSPNRRLILPKGTSFRGGSLRQTRVYDATTGEPAGPKLSPGRHHRRRCLQPRRRAAGDRRPDGPDARRARRSGSSWPTARRGTFSSGTGRTGGSSSAPSRCRPNRAGWPSGPTAARWPWSAPITASCSSIPPREPFSTTSIPESGPSPSTPTFGRSNGEARFSPDGRFLLTWERVPTLHVWDPDSGRLLHTLKHTERVENAAFNPSGPPHSRRPAGETTRSGSGTSIRASYWSSFSSRDGPSARSSPPTGPN